MEGLGALGDEGSLGGFGPEQFSVPSSAWIPGTSVGFTLMWTSYFGYL